MLIARVVLAIEFNSIGVYVCVCVYCLDVYLCVVWAAHSEAFNGCRFSSCCCWLLLLFLSLTFWFTIAARVDDVFWHAHVIKGTKNWESLRKAKTRICVCVCVCSGCSGVVAKRANWILRFFFALSFFFDKQKSAAVLYAALAVSQ